MATDDRGERHIFDKAIEIETPEERAAYVKSACGDDHALAKRINALLRAHEQADFLPVHPGDEEVTLPESNLSEGPGTAIGGTSCLRRSAKEAWRLSMCRAAGAHPPQGGSQNHQIGHGHQVGYRPFRGRASSSCHNGPSEYRQSP